MLETRKANGQVITGSVRLIHAAGMHARPAVKLTKLAKKFQAQISIRASDAAEWINAKSVSKIMALRAARDSVIEIKASGEDAEAAVAALVAFVSRRFSGYRSVNMRAEIAAQAYRGRTASIGFAHGPFVRVDTAPRGGRAIGAPDDEEGALRTALAFGRSADRDSGTARPAEKPHKSSNFKLLCWTMKTFWIQSVRPF